MSDLNQIIRDLAQTHVVDEGKTLSFEGRQLKLNTAQDAEQVATEIENIPLLEVLILKGNTINFPAAERIAEALKKCKHLKRALWSDLFTGRLKTETPPAMRFLCGSLISAQVSLVELDLSDNAFGPAGADAVKELLMSSSCYTLEVLKLNNEGLGIGGGKIIAQSLMECWKKSSDAGKPLKLKVFVAGRNRLEVPGAEALAETFKKIATLEEITMPQNGIYYKGIMALTDAFAFNPNLKRINLSDNTFTVKGASAMAKVLPKLKNVEIINFSDCLLRSRGGYKLAKAIKNSCFQLKELILNGNEFDKDAALSLAEAVLLNKNGFEKLEVGCNNIGGDGIEDLKKYFSDKKLSACLGSLSDDEGTADEEEENESEDDAEEENDEYDDATSTDERFVPSIPSVNGKYSGAGDNSVIIPKNVVETFLTTFDVGSLMSLGDRASYLVVDYLLTNNRTADEFVEALCRISELITPNGSSDVVKLAKSCCRNILVESFENFDVPIFTDFLAARIGLIKSEDKSGLKSLFGIVSVLETECNEGYFSPITRDILKFLIERRTAAKKIAPSDEKLLENLLKVLHN